MNEIKGFVGTYAPGKGIYSFLYDVQKEEFVKTDLFYPVKDAKYLSYYKNRLAFPTQLTDAGLCVLVNGNELHAGLENSTACYVVQDGDCVYTVNYHDGTLIRYRLSEAGLQEEHIVHIQHEAGSHQAILTGSTILVPCRLLDSVYVYDQISMKLIRAISFPKGTGIRHGVMDDHGRFLYMISEDSCEIFEMNMEQGGVITRKLSLLQKEEQGGGAAIRISADGNTLYASVRGVNRIYVIDIASWRILQQIDSGGDHPRDINLSPQGDYLFAANRNSGNLVVFHIDRITGMLEKRAQTDTIPEGVSIVFYK